LKRLVRLGLAVVVLAAAVWLWMVIFPGDEAVIRKRVGELARTASFTPDEKPVSKLANASHLASFFSSDTVLRFHGGMSGERQIQGRDELRQLAALVRNNIAAVEVRMLELTVSVEPGHQNAQSRLTAMIRTGLESDVDVQELKLKWQKIDGKWLITRLEATPALK
jgi:hypothetical protein